MPSVHGTPEHLQRHVQAHPASPLFARLAAAYLASDRPAEALKLGLEGLQHHPGYATGLYVVAKAQVMLRRYTDARATLERLLGQMPGCRAARRLLDQLATLELEYPPLPGARAVAAASTPGRAGDEVDAHISRRDDVLPGLEIFASRRRQEREEESAVPSDGTAADDAAAETPGERSMQEGMDDVDFDIMEVARRLEGARIPSLVADDAEVDTPADLPSEERVDLEHRPLTETLLSIYVQQGRKREAAEGYRRLARQHPDRADEFLRKAGELGEE